MKIVLNKRCGGFGLSKELLDELGVQTSKNSFVRWVENSTFGIDSDNQYEYRTHPKLIAAIEKLGCKKAGDRYANLEIIDIPDGIEWEMDEYKGFEYVYEKGRRW